jgi:transcriptional regulator with XRE-family HTH domain
VAENAAMRPRQRLGRELRDRRLLAGLSGPALAEQIGVTQSKVSRTETAKFRPDMQVIRKWLRATKTTVFDTERILALAEEAATEIPEYRTIFRGTLLSARRDLTAQDAASAAVRQFSLIQIPEPFQTRRYAELAISSMDGMEGRDALIGTAVEARMARAQRLIETGTPAYHVILMESALRHRPYGATDEDAVASRERLLEFTKSGAVKLQVIASGTPMRYAPVCSFIFTEFTDPAEHPLVSVQLPALEMTFSGADDITAFERTWSDLAEAALNPTESESLVRSIS